MRERLSRMVWRMQAEGPITMISKRMRTTGNDAVKDQKRHVVVMGSPIGPLLLESKGEALTGIRFGIHKGRKLPRPRMNAAGLEPDPILHETKRQLREYLAGKRRNFDLPLELTGTDFQRKTWAVLCEIPYGETISYAELARRVGHPRAVRAVGAANGANPVSLVVPCHRVIASSGGLGGYGGGLQAKQWLLELEGSR